MKYKGIIFDFNGVLLWDNKLQEEVWNKMSQNLRQKPFSKEEMDQHMHGVINKKVFEYLLGREASDEEAQKYTKDKEEMARSMFLSHPQEFILSPGAIELLTFLKDHSIPRTIATSSPTENIDFFVQHLKLDTWFDVGKMVYDDGTYPGKPAPDIYLKAAQKLHMSPEECVGIEDAISGIKSANEAGIGYIIAIGPKERHNTLQNLDGVNEVIENLGQVRKDLFEN